MDFAFPSILPYLMHAAYWQRFLSSFQSIYFPTPKIEAPVGPMSQDDPRLASSPYQTQFAKNYEDLKLEYREKINREISFSAMKSFLNTNIQDRSFLNTAYTFLCALAFYELNNKKLIDEFGPEDWQNFGNLFGQTAEEIINLSRTIFQEKDFKSTWNSKSDAVLKSLVLANLQKRLPWKKIAEKLNKNLKNEEPKKASQCSERWKNYLSKKCKIGQWSKQEDELILSFVISHGSKWSMLSKMLPERTEHNVKNRFFSLLSRHFSIPILKIKQGFNYLDTNILQEVKNSLPA